MHYIGIDIAKRSHVAAVIDADGNVVVESFKFNNTATGFARLLGRLAEAGIDADDCQVGMEATGHYWICLFDFLANHGFECAVINPIQTDAFRKVDTVRVTKTDDIDAVLIASLMRFKRFEASGMGDERTDELRQLARHRTYLVEDMTALKNKATAILDRIFPEYSGLFSDDYGPTSIALLKACAEPAKIASTDIRTLTKIVRDASKGHCGRSKADEIKAAAKRSIGVSFAASGLAFELRMILERIEFTQGQVKELEGRIADLLDQTQGKWLLTIPGIDVALAGLLAGEIGDANRFAEPKKLIAFAGMDATKKQSGESDDKGHMSKRGSSFLRYALMQAADCARKFDPYFGDFYSKKIAEGRHHYVALSGVARKLAGVILSVMKEQRAYAPQPPKHHQPGHLKG